MSLEIETMVLGPVVTNSYLVSDSETKQAVVIDPAWDGVSIVNRIHQQGLRVEGIWLTHAHFDHFGGLADLMENLEPGDKHDFFVGMHTKDMALWKVKGGAMMFGISIKSAPKPDHVFVDGEILEVGNYCFEVCHSPGHSPGHVIFHCSAEKVLFSGDLIFNQGIGRSDLLGGSHSTLIESIQRCVLPLPDETRIYSGHGPETTVGDERRSNPFLR